MAAPETVLHDGDRVEIYRPLAVSAVVFLYATATALAAVVPLDMDDAGDTAPAAAVAMLVLFTFVGAWNQFFWPFIVLDRQNPTLPVALSLLQSNYFVDYSVVLAGVLLSTVPLLLLFVFAGKQLVSGIMQGAVKG